MSSSPWSGRSSPRCAGHHGNGEIGSAIDWGGGSQVVVVCSVAGGALLGLGLFAVVAVVALLLQIGLEYKARLPWDLLTLTPKV